MTLLEAALSTISAVLLILSGAVGKLWYDNRKLSAQVAKLSEILGMFDGLKASVMSCPVQGCMLRGIVPTAFDYRTLKERVDAS